LYQARVPRPEEATKRPMMPPGAQDEAPSTQSRCLERGKAVQVLSLVLELASHWLRAAITALEPNFT